MTNKVTAKALRKMTPPQDWNDKAFQPERSFVVEGERLATSLNELRRMLPNYGDAAALSAEFDAVFNWLRKDQPAGLSADIRVVREALTLWREDVLFRVGLTRDSGLHLPILQRISTASQDEAEQVAAHTLALWEAAGRPCLTARCIRLSHRMFLYRVRLKEFQERRADMGLPS